ncbi:MAG: hypothetical protein HC888_01420 [Candidatus Competibacteraceae bacterium]|nr:hypothetical protein [Candidatus Competibacteraceae bacterium]
MAKYVLRRPFHAPNGRVYRRTDAAGGVLVHDFPEDWDIPKTAKPLEEAKAELEAAAGEPEPETLSAIAKQQHGKK